MDIEYDHELANNDIEYKMGLSPIDNNINNILEEPPIAYNPQSFESEVIIHFLQNQKLLKNIQYCSVCGNAMNMCKKGDAIDRLVWRCHKRKPAHDIKINIRKDSIFEAFQIKIPILYFLLFFCFSENVGINKAYEKCKNFCDQLGETAVTPASITKFFSLVRDKIRIKMHKIWEKELLGIEINPEFGYPAVEIDESKIISSGEEIYWMFGAIDRNTKDARIWCVLKDRTKDRLLPFVKKYINTDRADQEDEIHSIRTRVFSDSFSSYQVSDFSNLGFILKRINHSVWFGTGYLHSNTIESLWHQIKSINNNFTGLSVEKLKLMFNNDENMIINYLDGWICYSLFLRDINRKKLNWIGRINYLSNYLIV